MWLVVEVGASSKGQNMDGDGGDASSATRGALTPPPLEVSGRKKASMVNFGLTEAFESRVTLNESIGAFGDVATSVAGLSGFVVTCGGSL